MRELLLKRLEFLHMTHQGFISDCNRWRNCYWREIPVKDIAYKELHNADLLAFFEFIVYRHFKQM